jgi:large subunit ribosomal protein L6
MSRIANSPVPVPAGVEVLIGGQRVSVKGAKGAIERAFPDDVVIQQADATLRVAARNASKVAQAMAGTTRALLNNMIIGVSSGFERRLVINGVGYRAQVQGKKLNLTLGYSHPVEMAIPADVVVETPSQTEVVVRGSDKQRVGQVAANIRSYRKPEPYKGKGIRYADETIVRKEAKKT